MLVVAGFSLIIYYWAQAVRLPREEMLDLVNRQAGDRAGCLALTDRPVRNAGSARPRR